MEPNATGATNTPSLSVALRNGFIAELRGTTLTIGATSIPLNTLRNAALVVDTTVPVAPGQPPTPAVALTLADGASYILTPTEQADAGRLLQAIQSARPGTPPPPPPNYAPPGYGQPTQPTPAAQLSRAPDDERGLAVLAHLSGFFLPVILPLIFGLRCEPASPMPPNKPNRHSCGNSVSGALLWW